MARATAAATGGRARQRWSTFMVRWLRRRGPIHPPLELAYRQIFILPTGFGWVLGLLMLAMLMGSLNFNNNLGLLTTFIVAGLGVNSMLMAFRNLHRLAIRGGMAEPVFAGQPARYQLTLESLDGRERPSLAVRHDGDLFGTRIRASAPASVEVTIETWQRGWQQPQRMRIETTHPLGLFRAWAWFWPDRPILVWPKPAEQPPPLPESGVRAHGSQPQSEPEGEEYYSLRNWREGDPLHRIAWKASQRHRDLLSREFRDERSPELVFDLQRVPARDLETRIAIATAWVVQASAIGRAFTLRTGRDEVGPGHDRDHRDRCLRALAEA